MSPKSRGRLVVIGDALLDRDVHGAVERVSPDAPVPVVDESHRESRPGGAGLAGALAALDGRAVTLVTALGQDGPGRELAEALERAGVAVVDLVLHGPTPEKVRVRSGGQSLIRLDRGGRGAAVGPAGAQAKAAVASAGAVLVSDYGRGVAAEPGLRAALRELSPDVPVVWDPHPRGPAPSAGVLVATPNVAELGGRVAEPAGGDLGAVTVRARALAERWGAHHVCVTRGALGALLVGRAGPPMAVPAEPAVGGDPCGAGDRFSSRLVTAVADGAPLEEAVTDAVATASAFVSAGGAGAALGREEVPCGVSADGAPTALLPPLERTRASGGTVVATGGCFDLLHAGHVRTLEAARRLGDCLVVCLNSDASIRRIKGPDRPLVPEEDRTAVIAALGCVDAVVVFDEDTPERALQAIRPDIWVKGGDYQALPLPEEETLSRWGGRVVLLPYVEGRSTTRLIHEAAERVAS